MNILFISAVLPYPLHSGGQIRIYHLLKRLSKKHKVTLFSFIRNEEEREYIQHLSFLSNVETVYRGKALQPKYILGALGNLSWLLATYKNKSMTDRIAKELKDKSYDLFHIEPFYVYPSLPKTKLPIVVSEHNIEYTIYEQYVRKFPVPFMRPFLFLDVVKTRIWEEMVWKKSKACIAVSEEDKRVMDAARSAPVAIIPNGVDCNEYVFKSRVVSEKSLRCLFIGDFAWMPNKEAVSVLLQRIWPEIHTRFPSAKLTIVGKQFPLSLNKYVTGDIRCVGRVSDIASIYDSHNVLLAPMGIGGGTKFKLLEAFATGIHVLTTKQGAMGLSVSPTKEYLEVYTPNDYVKALEFLCTDNKHAEVMARNARKTIETVYNWDIIADQLDKVWKQSI